DALITHVTVSDLILFYFVYLHDALPIFKSSSGLSDDEIEKMVNEAEENAEEDKKRREEVDLRNEADQLVFTTDKTLKDLGDKVRSEEHTSELQSRFDLVCRLLLEKENNI